MDWIHCNACFMQPKDGDITKYNFFLTSCGHLFCENCGCFVVGTSNCCKCCRNECSFTIIEKSFRTNPQLSAYFQDTEEACEKMFRIMNFQKTHRNKLFRHQQIMLSKYNKAKSYMKKLESELKITKNALQNTSQESCSFKKNFVTSTPIFQTNSSPFKMLDNEASRFTPRFKQETTDKRNGPLQNYMLNIDNLHLSSF